jgi:hypothetical protein
MSLVTLEPPLPTLRRNLDQEGSFEDIGPHETVPKPPPREEFLTLEESIVSDLKTEGFRLENPSITDMLALLIIQIFPPEVNSPKQ